MASMLGELAMLVSRQALGDESAIGEEEDVPVACESGNEFDGRIGVRISAILVILITSSLGE